MFTNLVFTRLRLIISCSLNLINNNVTIILIWNALQFPAAVVFHLYIENNMSLNQKHTYKIEEKLSQKRKRTIRPASWHEMTQMQIIVCVCVWTLTGDRSFNQENGFMEHKLITIEIMNESKSNEFYWKEAKCNYQLTNQQYECHDIVYISVFIDYHTNVSSLLFVFDFISQWNEIVSNVMKTITSSGK